jgi:hypothetical protein
MDTSDGKESFVQQFAHQFDAGDTHEHDKANMVRYSLHFILTSLVIDNDPAQAEQLHAALCQSVLKMPAESRAGLYESFAQGGVVCNKPKAAPAHDEL